MGAGLPALLVFVIGLGLFGAGAYGVATIEVSDVTAQDRFFTSYDASFESATATRTALEGVATAYGGNSMEMVDYQSLNMTALKFTFSCTDSTTGSAQFPASILVEVTGPDNKTRTEELSSGCGRVEFTYTGATMPATTELRALNENDARVKLANSTSSSMGVGMYHFNVRAQGNVPDPTGAVNGRIVWKIELEETLFSLANVKAQIQGPR